MSFIYCPECGHEISDAAIACPGCGRPIDSIPVDTRPVIADPYRRDSEVPKWVFIPLGIIGALLVFFLVLLFTREGEDDRSNLNVNVAAKRQDSLSRDRTRNDLDDTQTLNVPPTSGGQPATDTQNVTVPGTQTGVTSVPSDKGTVLIDAKIIATRTGQPQPVKNEKFYLLDQDLETILSDAGLDPIEGNTLLNSLGLAVMYPERYGDFQRRALAAINGHIKHSGTTDASGKASISTVDPDNYYLFGVTRTSQGFAVWSSPVMIRSGQNILNLSPQRLTEIQDRSGE